LPAFPKVSEVSVVVEVEGLRKSYGDVERVHGISFDVNAGEIFGLIGVNGAGKTTTIEILEGYRTRNAGRVSVLGTDPARADRAWRNQIGLVLQECELDPVYTVRETVSMFSRYFRSPADVTDTIRAVGLPGEEGARIGHLSGGQKRRLDVALGLIGAPKVLFLDEPTTGLDPSARREMWSMVEGLRDAGTTIFLTTHYMDEAEHLADRIVLLKAGAIAAQGTPDELRRSLGSDTKVSFDAIEGLAPERIGVELGVSVRVVDGVARFRTDDTQGALRALLAWAEREHVTLANLQAVRPTLDDVFVELAGPAEDGSGAAAR
jgi:ABC-2 type transport system ATP-binding protein